MKYILNNKEVTQDQFYIELNKEQSDTITTEDSITLVYSEERHKRLLRTKRTRECFPIVNRGQLWHDRLSSAQQAELSEWYQAWLDVTETKETPAAPSWLTEM